MVFRRDSRGCYGQSVGVLKNPCDFWGSRRGRYGQSGTPVPTNKGGRRTNAVPPTVGCEL